MSKNLLQDQLLSKPSRPHTGILKTEKFLFNNTSVMIGFIQKLIVDRLKLISMDRKNIAGKSHRSINSWEKQDIEYYVGTLHTIYATAETTI